MFRVLSVFRGSGFPSASYNFAPLTIELEPRTHTKSQEQNRNHETHEAHEIRKQTGDTKYTNHANKIKTGRTCVLPEGISPKHELEAELRSEPECRRVLKDRTGAKERIR